jgi:hypothetical protein
MGGVDSIWGQVSDHLPQHRLGNMGGRDGRGFSRHLAGPHGAVAVKIKQVFELPQKDLGF